MLDRVERQSVNWLLNVGDFDILRDATNASAVFWHRARRGPVKNLIALALLLAAGALVFVAARGPANVGINFLSTATVAIFATVFVVGSILYFGWLLLKYLPSRNDRVIIAKRKLVREGADPLDEPLRTLTDEQLKSKTQELREKLKNGAALDDIRGEAYAAVREASRRARNHRQYECQLIGSHVLESGCVAEMRTGEGKTIVCYAANYLKVLQGLKVHMVTVNDYLVRRDAEFCKPIFDLLGVSVGYISTMMNPMPGDTEADYRTKHEAKRAAYACDITYGTNSEFGFDYLRDNMKMSPRQQLQGKKDFAVVDEVDSILIDEARTPLIISGPAHDDVGNYRVADNIARMLIKKQEQTNREFAAKIDEVEQTAPKDLRTHPKFKDGIKKFKTDPLWVSSDEAEYIGHMQYFVVELDSKRANMTEHGAKFAQQQIGIGSFYDGKNMNWPHYLDQALRAHLCYHRDKEYVVQEGTVVIVDEFTGRLMIGRQWSDGLHQAVEAKEGVQIKQETQTLATITLQNLFKMYRELAGMTGTAMTEADEFLKIYKLEVIAIPTNRPIRRVDYNDKVYKTMDDKFNAIVEEIRSYSQDGHPSDPFSLYDMLKQADRVLAIVEERDDGASADEAKRQRAQIKEALAIVDKDESDLSILAKTYREILGGSLSGRPVLVGTASVESSERLSAVLTKKHGIEHEVLNAKNHAREAEIVAKAGQQHDAIRNKQKEMHGRVTIATNMAGRGTDIVLGPGVAAIGGLHVVGTERHESRRIDNQLRGRCGRQGDPGSSRFFLSLDDELLRLTMGEWVLKMLNSMGGWEPGQPMEHRMLTRGIQNAQKKVEERNFGIRKNLLEYDEVMDHQRKSFYTQRQRVVESQGLTELIWEMIDDVVADACDRFYDLEYPARCAAEWVGQHLNTTIDFEKLDTTSLTGLQEDIRDRAMHEVRSSVNRTFGEYVDTDIPSEEWDTKGLQQWAEQYGISLTLGQIKESDPHDLMERIAAAAEKKIEDADLAPLEQYVDPLYSKARLVRWAKDKFGVDLDLDELKRASREEAEQIIRTRMRESYRQREISYPVEALLDSVIRGSQSADEAYPRIVGWVNRKFGLTWTVANIEGKQPPEIFDELRSLNEKYLAEGAFDDEIDRAIRENPGEKLLDWAKGRFRTLLDIHPLDLSGDVREQLRNLYYQMLRFELSYLEQLVVLQTLDSVWKDHMYAMDLLRGGIWMRGQAEKDPKIEYKREGTRLFNETMSNVRERVTDLIFKVRIGGDGSAQAAPAAEAPAYDARVRTTHADATGAGVRAAAADQRAAPSPNGQARAATPEPEVQKVDPIRREAPRVGRNDPCPCGSGKKFKQCHGKQA